MTAKITELARQIEAATPNREELQGMCLSRMHNIENYDILTLAEEIADTIAQRFQIIAQAAGGIIELCEQAEANKKAFEEAIKPGKPEAPSGRIYKTKSQGVQNG